jgi:GTP-binding protein
VRALLWQVYQLLGETPEPEPVTEMPVYRTEEDPNAFTVAKEQDGWRISGPAIERSAAMTYWEHEGSVRRFQKLMERLGVDKALREAGIEQGETVYVGDYELEWQD